MGKHLSAPPLSDWRYWSKRAQGLYEYLLMEARTIREIETWAAEQHLTRQLANLLAYLEMRGRAVCNGVVWHLKEDETMDFEDGFDFGADLPPDIPDGKYRAILKAVRLAERATKAGGCMFFLDFVTTEDGAADETGVGKDCTFFFMPKERKHPRFNFFARDVKSMWAAFGEPAPSVKEGVEKAETWQPLLEALQGKVAGISVSNEKDKADGKVRCRVKF